MSICLKTHMLEHGNGFYASVEDHTKQNRYLGLVGFSYKSLEDARSHLKNQIVDRLHESEQREIHWMRVALFCDDGHLLLVAWENGAWGYRILGSGAAPSSVITGDTLEEAVTAAKSHAEQCYGGIQSETRF